MFICFVSCDESSKDKDQKNNVAEIKVNMMDKYPKGDFEDYFSSSRIVSLETNEHSILSGIDRISFYNNKIFILDRRSESLVIFNIDGKYLSKIQNTGRGPTEYSSLMDFAIDEETGQLFLYCDRPYKILKYSEDGKFIEEKKLAELYFNMGYSDNKLLFMYKGKNKMLIEYDYKTSEKKGFFNTDEEDIFFRTLGTPAPSITKDKNIHVSLPYSRIIYEYDGKNTFPKYKINFGKNNAPKNLVDNLDKDFKNLNSFMKENKYAFGIANFRENKKYATFNFNNNMIVIFSKISHKAKAFSFFINDSLDRMPFYNYFAHNGNDNKLISIYQAPNFKHQMNIYKNGDVWGKLPNYIKKIDEEVSSSSNPLLIIYTFKE